MTDAAILARIIAYKCCRGAAVYRNLSEGAVGHVHEAEEAWERAEILDWAIEVLCAYPRAGVECHGQDVTTHAEVCCAVKLADPCCVRQGCQPTPPAPLDCAIVPTFTVVSAVTVVPNPCTLLVDGVVVEGAGIAGANAVYQFEGNLGPGGSHIYENGANQVGVNGSDQWSINGPAPFDYIDATSGTPVPTHPWDIPIGNWESTDGAYDPPPTTVRQATAQDVGDPCTDVAVGDSFYIVQGGAAGNIYTWNGTSYDTTPTSAGDIILASDTGNLWTNTGSGPGLLFPEPSVILLSGSTYTVSQLTTLTSSNRSLQLQGLGLMGWYNLGPVWTEDQLPQPLNIGNLVWTEVRFIYTLANGCQYVSGNGVPIPPIDPCAVVQDFSVVSAVDASQQGLLPAGVVYLIRSDEYDMQNLWAANVNSILNADGSFTPLTDLQTVYAQDTAVYWRFIAGAMAPLFPTVRATLGLSPGGYFLESDWISASAAGDRFMIVEAMVNGLWVVAWMGYEYDLPQTLSDLGTFEALRASYLVNGCAYQVTGTVVIPEAYTFTTDCSEQTYFELRYPAAPSATGIAATFQASAPPGEVIAIQFIAGEMPPGVILRGYSGTDNTGDPMVFPFGNYPSLSGTGVTSGQDFFFEIEAPVGVPLPEEYASWYFAIFCLSGGIQPQANVSIEDKCDEWAMAITVDIWDLGDATSVGIQYSVDGGPPAFITGITAPGPVSLGSFDYESTVLIILIHEQDPLANNNLGFFTSSGACPITDNACAPTGKTKIDQIGDLSELPSPAPFVGWAFLVISDTTGIGTYPLGTLLGALDTNTPSAWEVITDLPGLYSTDNPPEFWQTIGVGVQPYPLFPVAELTPTGNNPLNWSMFAPEIQNYSIPLNTPFALEVRQGFQPWSQVGTFTMQQLISPLNIGILPPFTNARLVWNYDSCPLSITGGVIINT